MNNFENFQIILIDVCSSTMDEAKKIVQQKKKEKLDGSSIDHIFCVAARKQTNGRGRGGSQWLQSSEDDFLPLTIVFPTKLIQIPLEWMSIAIGCALYDSLNNVEEYLKNHFYDLPFLQNKLHFAIKWPNDLILYPSGKKLSGILCESSVINGCINELYVGIGLNFFSCPKTAENSQNLNSASFFESLFDNQESAKKIVSRYLAKFNFKQTILTYFQKVFFKEIEEYIFHKRSVDQLKNLALNRFLPKNTILSVNKGTLRGPFLGLTDTGALLLEGVQEPIYAGDVSIMPTAKKTDVKENLKSNTQSRSELCSSASLPFIKQNNNQILTPIIAIDFGNTRAHFAYKNNKNEKEYFDLDYKNDFASLPNLKVGLRSLFGKVKNESVKNISIFYTTVKTNEKTEELLNQLKTIFFKIFPEIKIISRIILEKDIFDLAPMKGDYTVHRIGLDRALKFYFAFHEAKRLQENILIFSFGTAVTCEGVSKDGFILENFVFPGIQMAFNAMHDYTDRLPALIADAELFSPEGKTWNQEIYLQRGVFLSVAGAILTAAKLHSSCICYLNGGNAQQIFDILKLLIPNSMRQNQFKLVLNIETNMILELSEKLQKVIPLANPPNIILNSMIKSRIVQQENRNASLKEEDFRKIGGRIENSNQERLDLYMANKFKFHNREEWRTRILNSEVMIEQNSPREANLARKPLLKKVKPTYKVKDFDQIWLFHPPEYEPDSLFNIDTIYDDKDTCIFAKPPNLVIHAAGLYLKNTFVEFIAKLGYEGCSPVHRIDRETSGLLVCARKPQTRKILSEAFRHGRVKKMYLAVTKGTNLVPDKFVVNSPIGEPEKSLIRLKLWVNGKNAQPARTQFAKLSQIAEYSLFACLPVTGRTNQIRIHLASIGHWIIGDKMYHENESVFIEFYEKGFTQWVHENVIFPRHMLHNTGILFAPELEIDLIHRTNARSDRHSNEARTMLACSITKFPIICPLPDDMLEFEMVQNLLVKANISTDKELQIKQLQGIFTDLHNTGIDNYPPIYIIN